MKKLLCLAINSLAFCTAHAASPDTVKIQVTNQTQHTIYFSVNNKIHPSQTILPNDAQTQSIELTNIDKSKYTYFEIYFGKSRGNENCTFAYEFTRGISPAECSDINYTLSADGQSIILRKFK